MYFLKKKLALHHDLAMLSILFVHLYQLHTFKNNLLISNLIRCVNYFIQGNLFHEKNNKELFERRKQ